VAAVAVLPLLLPADAASSSAANKKDAFFAHDFSPHLHQVTHGLPAASIHAAAHHVASHYNTHKRRRYPAGKETKPA